MIDVRPRESSYFCVDPKQDNEYKRCGTANVFGVVEPEAGRHFTTATPNRSGAEFARMVEHVVRQYPAAETIHLVMDNLNIHCRKSLTDHFGEQKGGDIWDRLSVHYTPKHGMKRETKAWNRRANQKRTKIDWQFTRKKARKLFQYESPRRRG